MGGSKKNPLEEIFADYDRSQFEYMIRDAAAISRNDPEVIETMGSALDDPINYLSRNAERFLEYGIDLFDSELPNYFKDHELLEVMMIDELETRLYVIEVDRDCDIDEFFDALKKLKTYDLIADDMPTIDPAGDVDSWVYDINRLLGKKTCVVAHFDIDTDSYPFAVVTPETFALLTENYGGDDEPETYGNSVEVGFDCGYEDFLAALKTLDNYDMIADIMPTIDMGEIAADGDVDVWIEEINGVLDGKAYICCNDIGSDRYSLIIADPETFKLLSGGDEEQPAERNAIGDRNFKMQLADTALGLLVKGEDYNELANTKVEFGYLFVIDDHGIESLFKLETDKTTAYFAAQGDKLMRLNFNEELFRSTSESFLEMHGGNDEA